MIHCKLQAGCLLIILYIAFLYYRERRQIPGKHKPSRFDGLLALSIVCLIFDGLTAYFVNHQEQISDLGNRILHLIFLLSLDAFIFLLFLYMLIGTGAFSSRRRKLLLIWIPFVLNAVVVAANIGSLDFRRGEISNYSMGISAYTCFIMAGIYLLFTMVTFFRRWNAIESHKRMIIFTYLLVLAAVAGYQSRNPQALVTSIGVTVIILGVYLNQENPAIKKLSRYHGEMVMGFATLVENRDDSTGGHIKRTSMYVQLLAEELKRKEIPLCARIMAVADVFDAVSQNRCYREAMPLDRCFDIIAEGSGQDLDPVLAEVFLDIREKVEAVYRQVHDAGERKTERPDA